MAQHKKDITIIKGHPKLLLIAPHGVAAKPKDDINTDKLTYKIAQQLKCSAIVNDVFQRRGLDFNNVKQASKHGKFITAIREVADTPDHTLVVWVHGIDSDNLAREIAAIGVADDVQCLIGYGQPDRPTAKKKTVNDLIRLFKLHSIIACAARDGSNYGGRSRRYMNQWFKQNRYKLTAVESVQLELRYKGIRRTEDLNQAAQNIADALSGFDQAKSKNCHRGVK